MLNGVMGSRLLQHMGMFNPMTSINSPDSDYKIVPAIPTKYTVYNIYSGGLAQNVNGMYVFNGGMFPRLSNIIGQSATGKTSLMVSATTSAIDEIIRRFGPGYSELFFLDTENNTPTERFLNLTSWSPVDFCTKCNYSNKSITVVDLANLIIKIADAKTKFRKDYLLPSGLRDIDGREIMYLAPTFICLDSIAAVNPEGVESLLERGKDGELKEFDSMSNNTEAMRDAKAWTIFVRKIKPFLDQGNIGLYCINHKTKETKMSMYEKETRYLPFLGVGEKIKGGQEFIYQSYNILHIDSGEKFNDRNPVYGDDVTGFSGICQFVKNKGNVEGYKFPMVFDQYKGYLPQISDLEYLWQNKYGLDGTVKITLDVLPEVSFTRKTFLKTAEEFPQLLRALQFTTRFHASHRMLYRCEPNSLKDFGLNVPLEQRLAILYGYTTPYGKEIIDDRYKNFVQLAHANAHYYNFGCHNKLYSNVVPKNADVDRVSRGYTIAKGDGITPFDADLGLTKIYDGKYQILKSDLPIIK